MCLATGIAAFAVRPAAIPFASVRVTDDGTLGFTGVANADTVHRDAALASGVRPLRLALSERPWLCHDEAGNPTPAP
jgi:hypothetical protein